MQSAAAAGVNAVIASILVAGLALYGAQVFGELAVLRRRIVASMNRVNDLAKSSPVDAHDPDAAKNDGRAMYSRLNRLSSLAMGMPIEGLGSDTGIAGQ